MADRTDSRNRPMAGSSDHSKYIWSDQTSSANPGLDDRLVIPDYSAVSISVYCPI